MLLREVLDRPGTLFAWNGVPVVGQIEKGGDPMAGAATDLSDGRKLYNRQLRKLEQPFVRELTPATRSAIERRSYFGAYKGVTALLTKYLWTDLAMWLTRMAAGNRADERSVGKEGVS